MKHDCEEAYDVAFLATMPFEVQPLPGDGFQGFVSRRFRLSRVGGGSRTYDRQLASKEMEESQQILLRNR